MSNQQNGNTVNGNTNGAVKNGSGSQSVAASADLKNLKPRRRDFEKTVVVNANGAIVDEPLWRQVVGNEVQGKDLEAALKANGMQVVKLFMKDHYEAAKIAFYAVKHSSVQEVHNLIIDAAFKQAGVPKIARIESTLNSIFPIFKNIPNDKIITVFRAIINDIAQAGVVDFLLKRKPRTRRGMEQPEVTQAMTTEEPAPQSIAQEVHVTRAVRKAEQALKPDAKPRPDEDEKQPELPRDADLIAG